MSEKHSLKNYLVEEHLEDYTQKRISYAHALKLISALTGSITTAALLLSNCTSSNNNDTNNFVSNPPPTVPSTFDPKVSESDPALQAQNVQFSNDNATIYAYLAQPTLAGSYPIVLVCHENRGLTDHIKDVTRRLAKAGFIGLAVDLLSREGGTGNVADQAKIGEILGNTEPAQSISDFKAAIKYAQTLPNAQDAKIGMIGFCFGGGMTWRAATQIPELKAAVPFYGPNPPIDDVDAIQAPVLAIYGELDTRINAGISDIEAAMQKEGKVFEKVIYPGVNHAFHNDTGERYNAEAAQQAWAKTIAWLNKYLKS